jgi:DNA-binding MarR family transcriptional regulator
MTGSPGCEPAEASGPLSSALLRAARLHRLLATQLLREVGLHPGQELVMMQLWDQGPQRPADLVRVLGSDAATMTRTVQRLERAGFVRRGACDGDRRAILVESTPAGSAVHERVEALWTQLEAAAAGDLSRAEVDTLVALLDRVESNVAAVVEQPAPH